MFKLNRHGLDADFLSMFEYTYEKMDDSENELTLKSFDEIQNYQTR